MAVPTDDTPDNRCCSSRFKDLENARKLWPDFCSNRRGLYRRGQLLNYGEKRNLVDCSAGGFTAVQSRSIPAALSAGAAVAVTSTLLDAGGQITRTDNGKEYSIHSQNNQYNL
ncbi:hypothetical protein C5167_034809 [Papaver somniferum]|uniref:Uncharacterized protein n=1 Tax=Papaver somniferum TaxID=3469 RepID=A0A4Y7KE47_PAPSO|nr:hypothetical protein C5167_034809 [Papaver somniferum]